MTPLRPSRLLALNSLVISGVSCLVYCLTIYFFVMPESAEFILLFVLPFLSFIAINFTAVLSISGSLDKHANSSTLCSETAQHEVNRIHLRLVFGLHSILIPSAIVIHLLVMYLEDGGMQFLFDPDGWSLLINRIATYMLVGIVQSSVFDYVLSNLKNQWNFESIANETMSKLFNRLALMLLSIILFLGSAIPLFSTMLFDTFIDGTMPSIAINLDDSEDLAVDLKEFSILLDEERQQFIQANEKFQHMASYLIEVAASESEFLLEGERLDELVSDMYDSIPLINAYEKGMDAQNNLSYMFILMALFAGGAISIVYSRTFAYQLSQIHTRIEEMLTIAEPDESRLAVTGLDETAALASSFNRVLDHNAAKNAEIARINAVNAEFVPNEYISFLGQKSIADVKVGDHVDKNMTIMFVDIRSYTSMSELMTPQENFEFINEYLAVVGPCIKRNNGFVNHYLGDGLMALFPHSAEDAVEASHAISMAIEQFNEDREQRAKPAIEIGMGMHFGKVIFGIIGDVFRKNGNVISDAVNVASRLEGLNKEFGTQTIVSEALVRNLDISRGSPLLRSLGEVDVKGRIEAVPIFELCQNTNIYEFGISNFDQQLASEESLLLQAEA